MSPTWFSVAAVVKFIQHQPINNTFAVILLLVKWHSLYFIFHMAWLVIIIQFQLQNDSSNSYAIKKKMSSEIDIVKFSIKCILECRNNDELIYFIQFLFWEFAKLLYLIKLNVFLIWDLLITCTYMIPLFVCLFQWSFYSLYKC